MKTSAIGALEIHVLLPLILYPPCTFTARVRIPPGSDSLTQLRLRGRGVPAHGKVAAGDLYATLRVTVGKPDAALTAFLQDWMPEDPHNPRAAMEAGTWSTSTF